ncbi:MAG: Endoribonuclease YbeY [Mycoplasmataceae bacterium]|nr:MAG: Endoribonuclease YbeY [Mycoplasmataceae bacterium]
MLTIVNSHRYPLIGIKNDFLNIFNLSIINVFGNEEKKISAGVSFVTKNEIKELNKIYRKKDKETDVLSFKCDVNFVNDYLGDIVICYSIAQEQAIKYEHSLKRELCFLFLHGLLHLLGYDHESEDEEKIMFSIQDLILNELNIKR